jgi:hypothetical protein
MWPIYKLNTFIAATGGTVTTESGDYKIHSFTGDGCFVVSTVQVILQVQIQ